MFTSGPRIRVFKNSFLCDIEVFHTSALLIKLNEFITTGFDGTEQMKMCMVYLM